MTEKQRVKRQAKSKNMHKEAVQVKVKSKRVKLKDQLNNAYIQGQIRILNIVKNWLLLEFPEDGKKQLEKLETYLKNYADKTRV